MGHVGRELHQQRQRRRLARGPHELGENDWVLAKFDSAALHVWARRVDLEAGDSRNPREPLAHFGVAVDVGLEHAGNHRDTFWDRGQFFADERLDADVFEADGVEHSRRCLRDSRRRIPDPRLERKALRHEASEPA